MRHLLLAGQGVYYMTTGIWALVGIDSFQRITGPKTDLWLVKTVGALVLAIGAVLTLASFRRRVPAEVGLLAAGSATGLAAIDGVYVSRGRISPIYLLDGVVEAIGIVQLARYWRG